MTKKKKIILIISFVIITLTIGVIAVALEKQTSKIDKSSKDNTSVIDMSINTDDDDEDINWEEYENKSYNLTKSLKITEGGTYNLTGTISNGLITIDTTADVKIVLNDVKIKNSKGPAIYIANAQNTIIELAENSKNYLEDGKTYNGYDDGVIGTIYSHDDITFQGTGSLEVVSNNEDAIVGKDDLKITSGTYIINSRDDGIRGKDSVYIQDGTFTITSNGDGIKSTNDTNEEKGYILIENGNFDITSELDGIASQTKLSIKNGNFNITTGGGSTTSSTSNKWGSWGGQTTSTASAKGLKAKGNFLIENGTLNLNTSDDAIHCNNYVGIKNGEINITSGDDGIHADKEVIIDSGEINISKSYEGLEAAKITINGGDIKIVSSDDGINIAGGNDSSATNRPGQNSYNENTDNVLTINNGNIYVNSEGDGIDINGLAYINGGTVKVDGPEMPGNGTIDYDAYFNVNGGEFIGGGPSSMLQTCSNTSKLYSIAIAFNSTYKENDKITIIDSNKNIVATYQSEKSYNSLIVATNKFQKGQEYTIKVNDEKYATFTITKNITTIGNINGTGGQQGGNRGPRR